MKVLGKFIALVAVAGVAIVVLAAAKTFVPARPGAPARLFMQISTTTQSGASSTVSSSVNDYGVSLDEPVRGSIVSSPLYMSGSAPGTWYFEASFPIVLVDWDGKTIGQGAAQAESDWMTTDKVPFKATLEFTAPECAQTTDYCHRGAIILKNDNPSGDPARDKAVEIPVLFE